MKPIYNKIQFFFLIIFVATLSYGRNIKSIVSTSDRNKVFQKETLKFNNKQGPGDVIEIDETQTFQKIDGFGAAITGSTCFNLMQMKPSDRKAFLVKTFSTTKGLGFSYIRISIGCSDFSLSDYTCCDTKGIEHFSLTKEEREYVIPILHEILHINPNVKILASPWTCPTWMKVNNLKELKPYNSWHGGQLNPKYYQDYATYFVRWIQEFKKYGINIYSITIQNEPLNKGNSASLYMSWQEQQDFITQALAPAFQKSGIKTKVYAFDHNFNYDNISDQQQYPLHLYNNKIVNDFLSGAAYHNYGGNSDELLKIGAEHPDKELIFTETSIGMWNDGRNLTKRLTTDVHEIGLGMVNKGCCAVIVWNLMLDTDRGPYRPGGCNTCYGTVDIDFNDYKTISYNSHYYLIGHLSSVVQPDAFRIQTHCKANGIMCSAFKNPDGTKALIVLNENQDITKLSITTDHKRYIHCIFPPHSVISFKW